MLPFWREMNDLPPSFTDHPWLYLLAVFSLLMIQLLVLEWLWRIGWSMKERPAPLRHPSTVYRVTLMLLLVGTIIRAGPDAILLVSWNDIPNDTRAAIALLDNQLDTLAFIPFSAAWLLSYLTTPFIFHQLERMPIPLHLMPTWQQAKRPLKIGAGVLMISVALTFFR